MLLTTGASNDFSKQNIYDIAGNVNEWTLEYTFNTERPYARRGGSYWDGSFECPASCRKTVLPGSSDSIGFRVSLY